MTQEDIPNEKIKFNKLMTIKIVIIIEISGKKK